MLLETAAQIASEKGISFEPHINITSVSEVFSALIFGQRERDFISALKDKKGAKINSLFWKLTFDRVIYSPNSLNRRGVFAKEIKSLSRPHDSYKKLKEALEESIFFSYLFLKLKIKEKEGKGDRMLFIFFCFMLLLIFVYGLLL